MTSELLHSTRITEVVSHSFAICIKRPEGRFAVDGTYQVHRTGPGRYTILNLFQKIDPATKALVIKTLGSRLKGRVTTRWCVDT